MKGLLKKRFLMVPVWIVLLLLMVGVTTAFAVTATPSTNDINKANGWAHVNVVDVGPGEITVEFVSTRNFWSCFEFRTDGDVSQMIAANNYNTEIFDGLYPYACVNNSTYTMTITAAEYVEIRMVFGAERDERFDWTRFDVLPVAAEPTWVYTGLIAHWYLGKTWTCELISTAEGRNDARFFDKAYVTKTCGEHYLYGPFVPTASMDDHQQCRQKLFPDGTQGCNNLYMTP